MPNRSNTQNNKNNPRANLPALARSLKSVRREMAPEARRVRGPFDPPQTDQTPTIFVRLRISSNLATPTVVTGAFLAPFLPGGSTELRLIKVSVYGPTSVVSSDLPLVVNTSFGYLGTGGSVQAGPIFCDRGNLNHRAVVHYKPCMGQSLLWYPNDSNITLFTASLPGATSSGTYTSLIDVSLELRIAPATNTFY